MDEEKLAGFLRWMAVLRREDCAKYERISKAIQLLARRWRKLTPAQSVKPNISP